MTNQRLQTEVAEAMGWTDVQLFTFKNEPPTLTGYPPDRRRGPAKRLPNWPEDLPACMAPGGPWEWLIEQVKPWGGEVVLEITLAPPQSYGEGAIGYCCAAYTYPDDPLGEGISEKGGVAICHAVLAVRKKLDA